tara:strand:- start:95 stop:385 length:291 start_codon:yes stop_codon:yes gene_type:complete
MKKMSKALLARIKFRYDGYYESKSKAKVRENAMKMAANWAHEYPTGTPLLFIRDDIIACWERNGKVTREEAETATSTSKEPVHNYVKEGLPKLHGK